MANSTKRILCDQVMYRLSGGYPSISDIVQFEDIYKALEQLINVTFRTQHFTTTLQQGETIPDNLMLASYSDITVTSTSRGSQSILPAMPISLIRNMGVYDIAPAQSLSTYANKNSFIPLQRGQRQLLQSDDLLNDLLGQICYEVNGINVIYSKDITLMGISKVDMQLVVFDMSLYGETDILPIPSDMEAMLVDTLYKQFEPIQADPSVVTNYPPPNQANQK